MENSITQLQSLVSKKKYIEASDLADQIVKQQPTDAQLLLQCAKVFLQLGMFNKAAEVYQSAIAAGIAKKAIQFELCLALLESGKITEAENEARVAVQNDPKNILLLNLLGVSLKRQTKYPEAIELFKAAIKINPQHLSAWFNLGNVFLEIREGEKGKEIFLHALKIDCKNSEVHRLLAFAYRLCGEYEKSFSQLRTAKMLAPKNLKVYVDIAFSYMTIREDAKALDEIEHALTIFPENAELWTIKGQAYGRLKNNTEAIKALEKAIELNPHNGKPYIFLGRLFTGFDREKANEYFRNGVAADPNNIEMLAELCDSLNRSRYGDEGAHIEEAYQIACQIVDRGGYLFPYAHTLRNVFVRVVDLQRLEAIGQQDKIMQFWVNNLQVTPLHLQLAQVKTVEDRYKLLDFHHQWGNKVQRIADQSKITVKPTPKNRKKIRIGFMSSDLRSHPVTYFVLPIIEEYDRSRFELYCYSFYSHTEADNVQKYIADKVDVFRWKQQITDKNAAQMIADDQLDILFELGGSTDMNKLEVMAYRPAPIQVSWLGYPFSSGIDRIDYILVDPFIKSQDSKLLIEKPFEMPETWVSLGRSGFQDFPIDPVIPEKRKSYLTFGTMNNPYKYTKELLNVWGLILKHFSTAHFLFVRPEGGTPSFRANLIKEFAKYGVEESRIEFITVRGNHLQYYNQIDIALDTFPQSGGTTTCETIWMGVPVITLVGPAFFERLSYSNLMNAGLGDLCAFSYQEYMQKTAYLVQDIERREYLRTHLRTQITMSSLGNTKRFVENFQNVTERIVKGNKS